MSILKNFKNYFKSSKITLLFSALFLLVEVIAYISIPYMAKALLDYGISSNDTKKIISIGSMLLLISVISLIGSALGTYYSTKASLEFGKNLREGTFDKILGFSFKNIDELDLKSTIEVLNNDTKKLENLAIMTIKILFKGPFVLVCTIIATGFINPRLIFVLLGVAIVLFGIFYLINSKCISSFYLLEEENQGLTTYLQENYDNIFLIKSLGNEDEEDVNFNNKSNSLLSSMLKSLNQISFTNPLFITVGILGFISLLWFCTTTYLSSTLSVGDIVALLFDYIEFFIALTLSILFFVNYSILKSYTQRINNVLTTEADITFSNSYDIPSEITGKLEFQNVSFDYNFTDGISETPLNNISISLIPGTVLGVIGAETSGKATFLNMVPRFYDPTSGKVLLDGIDIRNYPETLLRKNIAFNIKSENLFNSSTHNDTTSSNMVSDDDTITIQSKLNIAKEFINYLPETYEVIDYGLDYKYFDKGYPHPSVKNPYCKNPKIRIIDDSAQSEENKLLLKDSLNKKFKDCITIINATNISSVLNADKIVLFDKGQIVASGTHSELLRTSLQYMNIFKLQQSKEV